jgi:hypothetical protein
MTEQRYRELAVAANARTKEGQRLRELLGEITALQLSNATDREAMARFREERDEARREVAVLRRHQTEYMTGQRGAVKTLIAVRKRLSEVANDQDTGRHVTAGLLRLERAEREVQCAEWRRLCDEASAQMERLSAVPNLTDEEWSLVLIGLEQISVPTAEIGESTAMAARALIEEIVTIRNR